MIAERGHGEFPDAESPHAMLDQLELGVVLRNKDMRDLAVTLLQAAGPEDGPQVAEMVRTLAARPDLREALQIILSLDTPDLQLAADTLRVVLGRSATT